MASLGLKGPSLTVQPQPTGGGGVPPFSREFFVDAGTLVPVPMQDGSVGKPFSSIPAAITAAALGGGFFTIYVTPGTYVGTITLPDLDGMAIIGTDNANTIIENTAGDHTIKWTPAVVVGATVHSFRLEGMTVRNTSIGFDCIHIDGNAVNVLNVPPATFMDTGLELVDCIFLKTVVGGLAGFFRCVGRIFPTRVTWRGTGVAVTGPVTVVNCSTFVEATCINNGTFTLQYDPAVPTNTPATGRNLYAYTLGTIDFLDATSATFTTILLGAPIFVVDDTSVCIGIPGAGGAIDGTGLTSFFGPGQNYQPRILLNGIFGSYFFIGALGGVSLTLPPPAVGAPAATAPRVDFSLGRFFGTFLITRPVGPLPPAVGSADVSGREATFYVSAPGAVTAGPNVNMDIRDCANFQASLAVLLTGTIDRSKHFIFTPGPLLLGANIIPIVPPFPTTAVGPAGYQVSATPNTPVIIGASVPSGGKTPAAFTVIAAAVGAGYDFLISRLE